MTFNFTEHPHRRFNPLTGEWILVSPHRNKRPWQGKEESPQKENRPEFDPGCYLCPGNKRAGGIENPNYKSTNVFTNDFSALLNETPKADLKDNPLLKVEGAQGICRVICFSPRHDLTLPEMSVEDINVVVNVWADQITELGKDFKWVQIFENKGAEMGCSNPHPHGQVWAGSSLPNEPAKEDKHQFEYFEKHKSPLLFDYLKLEQSKQDRVVIENEDWLVVVPFWAVWPFETLLLPKATVKRLPDLSADQRLSLAEILKALTTQYDNLFQCSFPYSMGWHGAPTDESDYSHWQLHAHFYPPLLRSATVKKFMVGYEMTGEPQRDITAEQAADQLRQQSDRHYKSQ